MELFKLLGTIAVDNQEANSEIDETTEKAKSAQGAFSSILTGVGKATVQVGKTVAAGIAAGSAAVGAVAKQALDSYASYEQLVGGVETLFGLGGQSIEEYAETQGKAVDAVKREYASLTQAQNKILQNASGAYKTAGMSANEYMETVTSFSASLLQSLGGDTKAAADYAQQAIVDMSDNANKMGTNISMIQNAYQGFAKQNYSMLDNLKLGYGGTQQEMFRLMQDAQALGATFNSEFYMTSKGQLVADFADITTAIHAIQTEMGITGTTAKEASSTIEGSLASTKAAWQNLLTGFADSEQDLSVLVSQVVESAMIAANNILPRIQQILGGIVEFIKQMVPVIASELPAMLNQMLPGLIEAATALMIGIVGALPQILQILISQVPFIVTQIATALQSAFPALLETVKGLFQQIWDYISLELLNTGVSFSEAFAEIQVIFQELWAAAQVIWASIGQPIFDMVQTAVGIVYNAFAAKMPEIKAFVSKCFADIKTFWENNLQPCLQAIGDFIRNILAPAFAFVFNEFIVARVESAFQFIKDLWDYTLKPIFVGITDFLTGVFTGNWKQAFDGLVKIVEGIFNGIINKVKYPINKIIDLVNSFIKGLNKLKIPDWVPAVGGKGINIPLIPKLEKGGILKKGQMGFLEGSGDEAVVPLHQNRAWISAVAKDMKAESGADNGKLQQIIDMLSNFFPQLVEASGHDIVTNDGVIVAHYAPKLNMELGKIASRKDRGR